MMTMQGIKKPKIMRNFLGEWSFFLQGKIQNFDTIDKQRASGVKSEMGQGQKHLLKNCTGKCLFI